jgi:signal transduction histidine kinase
VVLLSGVSVGVLSVLVWGWIRFSQEFAAVSPGRAERLASIALLVAAPVLAVPGLVFSGPVIDRPYPPLGVVYRQAVTTRAGDAALVLLTLVAATVLVRLVGAWRRGIRYARPVAAAYATMLAFALCEGLATVAVLPLPLLLDWGFAAPVLAVSWMTTSRLLESARNLDALRAELAGQVAARSLELSAALERLHRSEKLASLGRFANGVAHQVYNPAAVVTSSLAFLADRLGPRLAADEVDALADARAATERITFLVRRLVDAARVSEALPGHAVADLATAIGKVVALQAAPAQGAVRVRAEAAEGARVPMRPDALELVLETLVRSALDATPAAAARPVEVLVERRGERIRIVVSDQGPGMNAEALARALDPFFATAAWAHSGGVGLAVARGLAQASGGELSLESAPGAGTRAILELPEVSGRARIGAAAS